MNTQTLTLQNMPLFFNGVMPVKDFRFDFSLFSAMRQNLRSCAPTKQVTVMGRADFIHHVTLHMPEVAALIEESDFGILHLEMGAMKLATRDAMLRYEFHTLRQHFSFIGYLFGHADQALYDAIMVSYLGSLFVGETSDAHVRARTLLPEALEEALKKAEFRYELHVLYGMPYSHAGKEQK